MLCFYVLCVRISLSGGESQCFSLLFLYIPNCNLLVREAMRVGTDELYPKYQCFHQVESERVCRVTMFVEM